MDLYKLDMNRECVYKKMQTQTPISDTQKGRLEKIVIENNTYDRYYEAKHAKADSGLVAKNKAGITLYEKLSKELDVVNSAKSEERDEIRARHSKEIEVRNARQEKEMNVIREKQRKEDKAMEVKHEKELDVAQEKANAKTEALSERAKKIESVLEDAGLKANHVYRKGYIWAPDTRRFSDEYNNWLRDLRARIITATSAEEAKALVDEFLLK